jgi:hypothetical protein
MGSDLARAQKILGLLGLTHTCPVKITKKGNPLDLVL